MRYNRHYCLCFEIWEVSTINIKDILARDEEVLFEAQQHRLVPGGKEEAPGKIFVTDKRVIIETAHWLGLKKDFDDLRYADIEGVHLKKNVFSSELVIRSRFKEDIELKALGEKEAEKMEQIVSESIDRYRYGYGGNAQVR